jgi:hypothetical protein
VHQNDHQFRHSGSRLQHRLSARRPAAEAAEERENQGEEPINSFRPLILFSALFLAAGIVHAKGNYPDEVKVSTTPIGSSFLRHYAYDYNLDLYELVKFEKRGFGRSEIITIALISQKTGKPMKEYGKRRLNEKNLTLKKLAEEAGMDYAAVYKQAQDIKKNIELKGEQNLPPPVFEKKPDPKEEKDKKDPMEEKKDAIQ